MTHGVRLGARVYELLCEQVALLALGGLLERLAEKADESLPHGGRGEAGAALLEHGDGVRDRRLEKERQEEKERERGGRKRAGNGGKKTG